MPPLFMFETKVENFVIRSEGELADASRRVIDKLRGILQPKSSELVGRGSTPQNIRALLKRRFAALNLSIGDQVELRAEDLTRVSLLNPISIGREKVTVGVYRRMNGGDRLSLVSLPDESSEVLAAFYINIHGLYGIKKVPRTFVKVGVVGDEISPVTLDMPVIMNSKVGNATSILQPNSSLILPVPAYTVTEFSCDNLNVALDDGLDGHPPIVQSEVCDSIFFKRTLKVPA